MLEHHYETDWINKQKKLDLLPDIWHQSCQEQMPQWIWHCMAHSGSL